MSKSNPNKPHASGPILAALDIGSTKIVCLIARVDDKNNLKIIGQAIQQSNGIKSGNIVDLEAVQADIGNTVHQAEKIADETIDHIIVNIPALHTQAHNIPIVFDLLQSQVTASDIQKIYKQAKGAEVDGQTQLIHSMASKYRLDSTSDIRDPIGMFGQQLSTMLHAVTVSNNTMMNVHKVLSHNHLNHHQSCSSAYAAGLGTLVKDEQNMGCVIIDIGGGVTDAAVFVDGYLAYSTAVPIGGGHITYDIARGLTTPLIEAERIKTLHGSALQTTHDDNRMIDVPLVGEYGPENTHSISCSFLTGIIRPRVEEIFELVLNKLQGAGNLWPACNRVVLTGGAAQLAGMREVAQMVLNKQVRIGAPYGINDPTQTIYTPSMATAVGLLLYGLDQEIHQQNTTKRGQKAGVLGRGVQWFKENW